MPAQCSGCSKRKDERASDFCFVDSFFLGTMSYFLKFYFQNLRIKGFFYRMEIVPTFFTVIFFYAKGRDPKHKVLTSYKKFSWVI